MEGALKLHSHCTNKSSITLGFGVFRTSRYPLYICCRSYYVFCLIYCIISFILFKQELRLLVVLVYPIQQKQNLFHGWEPRQNKKRLQIKRNSLAQRYQLIMATRPKISMRAMMMFNKDLGYCKLLSGYPCKCTVSEFYEQDAASLRRYLVLCHEHEQAPFWTLGHSVRF